MANGAKVRTGLATLMQDHLSSKVVNLMSNAMPLVYFLLAKDGQKSGQAGFYGLGRYASGYLISGVPVGKVRREEILNSDTYMPIVQTYLPVAGDGKVLGMYDTMPTRTSWDTKSPGTYFTRPYFKWIERVDPIMVPKKELRRTKNAAGNEKLASAAVGDLFKVETEAVLTTHLQWWNSKLWDPTNTGPSNTDAAVWDSPNSIASALKADNVYGGVDRSISGNSWYRGNYVTAHRAASLEDLVNEANFTFKCAAKGFGIELLIVGADLMPVFMAEARAKGGQIMYDGLPNMGEVGFKRPIVRFNNTYVVYDPQCPCKANGDDKNAVAGLNLATWTLALSRNANFTIDEPFDLSKTDGGKDAIKSQIRTELMLACEAPSLNAWWEDVG